MDFEFTRWHNKKIVLVSGAIGNYSTESRIIKLEGHPLVLNYDSNFSKFNIKQQGSLINFLSKSMRNKLDVLESFSNELQKSLKIPKQSTTLDSKYILNYLNNICQHPIIVLWNGKNDADILCRLNISVPVILNLTAHDDNDNKQYFLKLMNLENGEVIFIHKIGSFEKNGRMLSLQETHSIICGIKHPITTHVHDPVVDVLYTKCIFNFILKLEGYNNILIKAIEQ